MDITFGMQPDTKFCEPLPNNPSFNGLQGKRLTLYHTVPTFNDLEIEIY